MTSAKHTATPARSGDAPLRLKLFGPFEALFKGDPLPRLRSRKGLELLALLALYGGQDLSRDWLAEALWPDSLPESSLASLRVTLADLARALGDTADLCLRRSRKTLGLRLDLVQTDLAEFRAALQTGDPAVLRSALSLSQRPLLEGWDETWLLQDREETGIQYAAALDALANHALQQGEPAEAMVFLQKAVLADPLRQAAQRQLMNLLAASGDFKAADQCYQRFKETLYERCGAEPEPETTQLHRQIRDRRQRASRALNLPGAGESEGAASSRSVCRAPRPLTRLIGRDTEMSAIEAGLAGSRLVTLTGPGGVGKTRLALEAAHRCAADYADGAWFVDLSGTSDSRLLPAVFASALGIPDASGRASSDADYRAVSEALSSREMLLVLDNVERLVEVLSGFISSLLPITPRLRVLATGRQRVGITGEKVLRITPLAVPAAVLQAVPPAVLAEVPENLGSVDRAMQSAAVQLFVERAVALCPAFRLTLDNVRSVTDICRYLEGLPLALELTAACIESLSPGEIADRLKRQASLPAADSSRPERHQTLRAAIDGSWDQLTVPERALFRRLSVFQGGWTLESAEQVCADGWNGEEGNSASPLRHGELKREAVLPALSRLITRSLVSARPCDNRTRYSMLRLIQNYAAEKLMDAGEAQAVQSRHLRRFRSIAEQASRELAGPAQPAALARLDDDLDNLRAALGASSGDPSSGDPSSGDPSSGDPSSGDPSSGDPSSGVSPTLVEQPGRAPSQAEGEQTAEGERTAEDQLRLAAALGRYWQIRGLFGEGRRWLEDALSKPSAEGPARADALAWAGALALYQGDFSVARRRAEEALETATGQADFRRMAGALGCLGVVAKDQGDLAGAQALFERSLEHARRAGDSVAEASALGYLGILAASQSRFTEARDYYEAALQLRRTCGDRWGIAASLNNLGLLARQEGDVETARRLLTESLTLRRSLHDRRCTAITLNQLGGIALAAGEVQTARDYFRESLQLSEEIGDPRSVAYSLEAFAALALSERRTGDAAYLLGAAASLREHVGTPLPPSEDAAHVALLQQARSGSGPGFQSAWAAGSQLTRQELTSANLRRYFGQETQDREEGA